VCTLQLCSYPRFYLLPLNSTRHRPCMHRQACPFQKLLWLSTIFNSTASALQTTPTTSSTPHHTLRVTYTLRILAPAGLQRCCSAC
jgi:hypothetical protein